MRLVGLTGRETWHLDVILPLVCWLLDGAVVDAGFGAAVGFFVLALSVAKTPDGAARTLRFHVHEEKRVDRVAVEWLLKLRIAALEVEEDALGNCAEDHDGGDYAESNEDDDQADSEGFIWVVDVVGLGVAGIEGAYCRRHVDDGRLNVVS